MNLPVLEMEKNPSVLEFIHRLPKTETHLHIEGALPFALLQKLDPQKYDRLPASYTDDFKFETFAHFEEQLLDMACQWYTSPERYHEAAKWVFQRHLDANVKYVETSFASGIVEFLGINAQEILAAIHEAVPSGLEVRVFFGIHHNGYVEHMRPIIDECANWEGLAGVDLHGTESFPLEDWTATVWENVRAAGKFTKAHAGEFCGADFVKRIVEDVGAQRIEHGVRAIEDSEVVALLADRGIALDVCPISNVKLDVVPSMREHPLKRLMDAGVVCTVSTDDPLVFGNSIADEYLEIYQNLELSKRDLAEIAQNGFRIALAEDTFKSRYIGEIDDLLVGCT